MSDECGVDKAAVKLVEEDEVAGKTEKLYEDIKQTFWSVVYSSTRF